MSNNLANEVHRQPGQLSRYSEGQRSGRPVFDSQQGQEIFLFPAASRQNPEPTSYPVGTEGKAAGAKS
jgi:hypothetical protein